MEGITEDEEWEYVYDPIETETITMTIDLSAAPQGPVSEAGASKSKAKSKVDSAATNGHDDLDEHLTIAHGREEERAVAPSILKAKSNPTIQFLNLPGKTPYISWKGQIYSAAWGENIGSDMILASAGDVADDVQPIIKGKDGKWMVLGISQTTLVAKPIEAIKKTRLGMQPAPAGATADMSAQKSTGKPITVSLGRTIDQSIKKQAGYLEQLAAVKAARGDKDIVHLGKGVNYTDIKGKKRKASGFSKKDREFMQDGNAGLQMLGPEEDGEADDSDGDIDPELDITMPEQNETEAQADTPSDMQIDPQLENSASQDIEPVQGVTPASFEQNPTTAQDQIEQEDDDQEVLGPPTKTKRNAAKARKPRARSNGGGLFRDFKV